MQVADIWDKLSDLNRIQVIKQYGGELVTIFDSKESGDYAPDLLMYHVDFIGAAHDSLLLFVC